MPLAVSAAMDGKVYLSPGVADVVRAVEGSLTSLQGAPPREAAYTEDGEVVRQVWLAVEETIDSVLGVVTLADLADWVLPGPVAALAAGRAPSP